MTVGDKIVLFSVYSQIKARRRNKRNHITYGFRNTFFVIKLMDKFFARPVASKSVW